MTSMTTERLLAEKREEILRLAASRGARNVRVFGSVVRGEAREDSDIDLLVHFRGNEQQRQQLMHWLEGWSRCLGEINYFRTGYRTDGLLDIHLITDEDIAARSSFASKIDALTDPARKLPLNQGCPAQEQR